MSPDDLRKAIDTAIAAHCDRIRAEPPTTPAAAAEADAMCRRARELGSVLHGIVSALVATLPADEPDASTIPEHHGASTAAVGT